MPNFRQENDGSLTEHTRKAIVDFIHKEADAYTVDFYEAKHREHLGISTIGEPCARKIWYSFRWVKLVQFPARMRRLFNRGHNEEDQFIKLLFGIGCKVHTYDKATGKQWKVSSINNHYGGSTDSIGYLPWLENLPVIFEFKTFNDKYFKQIQKETVRIAQPKYYGQICSYGRDFNIRYCLFCGVNKNDDDLYFELVELDWNYATQLENKARDIITSKLPPNRISDNPAYWTCKYCSFSDICHNGAPVEINCRSCKFAEPAEKAQWKCTFYNDLIPTEWIAKGCPHHASINSN